MSALQASVNQRVLIITLDGHVVVGTLKGFDQTTNVILTDSEERIYSSDRGVEVSKTGVYLGRGDNIAIIGELDEAADAHTNLETIMADPIPPIYQQQ